MHRNLQPQARVLMATCHHLRHRQAVDQDYRLHRSQFLAQYDLLRKHTVEDLQELVKQNGCLCLLKQKQRKQDREEVLLPEHHERVLLPPQIT